MKNFALLDNNHYVIGTICLPGYLDFDKPHHVPHVEMIGHVEIGYKYDLDTGLFIPPKKSEEPKIEPLVPEVIVSSHDEINRAESDPPLAEGKRSLFSFLRRKK